ncbi:MAG TPA: FAD-binding oxidoreductase [Acidimicrobiales bacterium]|nr:FAD-binding oxidoreductase [Acidimicrobiales bacterium]
MSKDLLDRRVFFRRAAATSAISLSALGASLALDDCSHPTPGTTSTSTPTSTTTTTLGPATSRDWASLATSLSGTLVRPSSASYVASSLLYNEKFVDLHPQGIAYCESSDDVARCVDFATSHDMAMCARSGGHSYAGYSSCDGLVIDVSRLNGVRVNTSSNTAVVGAGALLIDVYNEVGANNRLLPGGSCPTVGIAGLALGGGIGVFARRYGLTSDNLRALEVVTADGTLVRASESEHADMLWASRGGGGGNFGVVTSFTFDVHAMPEVTLFTLQYPWAAAASVLEAWLRWVEGAPDELWSNCVLESQGTYGFLAQVGGVFCGSPDELATYLSSLKSAVAATPTYSFNGSNSYLSAMEIEAGCSGLSVAACHLSSQNPHGVLSREAYSAKSSYLNAPLSSAGCVQIVNAVEHLASLAPTLGGALAFDSYGGVINRVASDATAFVHRDKLACIQATYSWSTGAPASVIDAGQTWLNWLGADVFNPATGAYQNYIDPTLRDWPSAYYGGNFERLVSVKRLYDPDNRFSFAQSIPVHTVS